MIAALSIGTRSAELEREAMALDLLKEFEFTSYNLLFDLCRYLKSNAEAPTLDNARQEISSLAEEWCAFINDGTGLKEFNSPVVSVGYISVEEYTWQQLDEFQMRYSGYTGEERWFVTGGLRIEFWDGGALFKADFTIRVAV